MVQYPHILRFNQNNQNQEHFRDDNGFIIVPPEVNELVEIPCRLEVNDKGRVVKGVDGESVEFGFVVYMPLEYPDVAFGESIEVYNHGSLIGKGEVKLFSREFFHCRLWV